MSEFTQFDNAKLMIAASVRHCRLTIEELPVGQIVIDEIGKIRSIDASTERILGFENACGRSIVELLVEADKHFPRKLSPMNYGDLGVLSLQSTDGTLYHARVVCVPVPHPQTFLLSLIFQSAGPN